MVSFKNHLMFIYHETNVILLCIMTVLIIRLELDVLFNYVPKLVVLYIFAFMNQMSQNLVIFYCFNVHYRQADNLPNGELTVACYSL